MNRATGLILLCVSLISIGLTGCKDTKADHDAALLETCKLALDARTWDDAIAACKLVLTDEGYHLTAQAYMGRADASMFSILSGLSGSGGLAALVSGLPTAAQIPDYLAALDYLLVKTEAPTQTVYLEGLFLSAMLILKETKTLLALDVVNGSITHCASSGDISNCSFNFTLDQTSFTTADLLAGVIPVGIAFSGMGAAFYDGVCLDSSTSTHTTKVVAAASDLSNGLGGYYDLNITEDMTVDGCTVASTSPLRYNKIASDGLTLTIDGIGSLKFYDLIDTGQNYTKTLSEGLTGTADISVCNSDAIPVTAAGDGKINDCEMLYFMENLSL